MNKQLIFFVFIFIFFRLSYLFAQTCPGGVPTGMTCLAASASSDITAHSTCRTVTNTHASGKAIMISHSTSSEWSSFIANPPSGVLSTSCSGGGGGGNGYFVLSMTPYSGNMGGLSGADASCLSQLQSQNWKNKGSAGTLTAGRVKAFLCASGGCNNLQPTTTYQFAVTGDVNAGGATFTTDSSGRGPGDSATWETQFGVQMPQYYTGRATGTGTLWSNSPSAYNCSDWTSSHNEDEGTWGVGDDTGSARWQNGTNLCVNSAYIICIVHP